MITDNKGWNNQNWKSEAGIRTLARKLGILTTRPHRIVGCTITLFSIEKCLFLIDIYKFRPISYLFKIFLFFNDTKSLLFNFLKCLVNQHICLYDMWNENKENNARCTFWIIWISNIRCWITHFTHSI